MADEVTPAVPVGSPVEQELGLSEQLRKLWPDGVTQCKWCGGFGRPPCGCPADEEIERLRADLAAMTIDRDSWADQASQRTQDALDLAAAERKECVEVCERVAAAARQDGLREQAFGASDCAGNIRLRGWPNARLTAPDTAHRSNDEQH